MTIYVDGLLLLNFFFDFLLLMTTSIILKRNVSIFRITLGAFIGSLSILVLFFKIGNFELFLIKFYLGFLMCIISFGYKNIKNFLINFSSFYLISIILGGFLYYLNLEFSYNHSGLLFYHKGVSVNVIFLCIISPVILYIYIRQVRMYKYKICNYYKVNIFIGRDIIHLNGYMDSGNNLIFKGKFVIISNIKNKFRNKKYLVPYNTASGSYLMEVIKVRRVEVIGIGVFDNIYLGFSDSLSYDVLLNGGMIC